MKYNIIKDFNLPGYIKGKSFAKASELIENKFKGRNDKVSLSTKEDLLKRLRDAQEFVKQKEQLGNNMDTNEAKFGALFGKMADAKVNPADVGNALGSTMNAIDKFTSSPSTGLDYSGDTVYDINQFKKNNTVGAVTGLGKGAASLATGDVFGAIDGFMQAGTSMFGNKAKKTEMEDINNHHTIGQSNKLRPYAYGGKMNSYSLGGPTEDELNQVELENDIAESEVFGADLKDQMEIINNVKYPAFDNAINNIYNQTDDSFKGEIDFDYIDKTLKTNNKTDNATVNTAYPMSYPKQSKSKGSRNTGNKDTFKKLGKIGTKALEYSPIIGELFNKINRPITDFGTRITGRANLGRIDEAALENSLNDQNINEAIKAGSAGNLGSFMSGSLAAELNRLKAKGNAANQAQSTNLNQGAKEFQLDRQGDLANMAADERFIERSDRNEGAYQTAKDNRRASILKSASNIGREESNRDLVKQMFGYTWDGEYYRDKKGNKISESDFELALKTIQNSNMFGGYLKKK